MNTLVHCVYVLVSRCDNQFYIGTSSNLAARLYAHECGETKSTRRRRPFTLLFTEHFLSKTDALRREMYFKTTVGKRALRIMLKDTLVDFTTGDRYSAQAALKSVVSSSPQR
jgi:putative endonuclease